jgi:hypothetical protein
MATKKKRTPIEASLSTAEAKELSDKLDAAIDRYAGGTVDELEQALGFYILGRHVGWRVLVVVHNKRTIRKYEEILGISIREVFPETAAASDRSIGYSIAKTVSNFWKAVSGEIPIENRRKLTDG